MVIKLKQLASLSYLLFVLLIPSVCNAEPVDKKPHIVVLATGGTIAGSGESAVQGEYSSGELSVEDLIKAVPDLQTIADLSGEQISNIGSQDMSKNIWLKLAKRINQLVQKEDVDGIVITHGTDTMEETAYFLHLTLHTQKPVVLVGSMRPATALSSDGPANLFDAVSVAASSAAQARGVMVVMNGHIFSAGDVIKSHTTNVDSFASPSSGPLGSAGHGHVEFTQKTLKKHTYRSDFSINNIKALPSVEIAGGYADPSIKALAAILKTAPDGIIYIGLGNGNIPSNLMPLLTKAQKKGTQIVRTSRSPEGATTKNGEMNDTKTHFIASGSLNAAKSRVLLMLALTKTHDPELIQTYFDTY